MLGTPLLFVNSNVHFCVCCLQASSYPSFSFQYIIYSLLLLQLLLVHTEIYLYYNARLMGSYLGRTRTESNAQCPETDYPLKRGHGLTSEEEPSTPDTLAVAKICFCQCNSHDDGGRDVNWVVEVVP